MDEKEFQEFTQIKEATFDVESGKARILIIEEGFNVRKTRYYTKEALEKGAPLFIGKKMYKNHESDWTTRERGARDIDDWVALIESTETGITKNKKTGMYGVVSIHDSEFKKKLKDLKEAGQLGQLGVSIVAFSDGERKDIEGTMTNVVNEFIAASSVDFVSEPGAGGRVENFKESIGGKDEMDIKDLTVEKLKESNPDLLKSIVADVTVQVKEALKAEDKATIDADAEKDKNEESDKEKGDSDKSEDRFNVREANLDRKELLNTILADNALPANAKERVRESVLNTDVKMNGSRLDIKACKESIAKIIESEENYIKEFSGAKVTGNGSQVTEEDATKIMESCQNFLDAKAGLPIKEAK